MEKEKSCISSKAEVPQSSIQEKGLFTKKDIKYGGVNSKVEETWQGFLSNANSDFISVILLWYSGVMVRSTYAWMFSHTIEKYLKAYLLASENITLKEAQKYNHDIQKLWKKFKEVKKTELTGKPKLNEAFDILIDNISTIKISIRYNGQMADSSFQLIYFFIVLCSFLRYLLIGKKKYRETLYGLEKEYFIPFMHYSPISESYGKIIVRKMLHIALEHAGAFTNLGLLNSMSIDKYSISNTAIFEKLEDCPICNDSSTDILSMMKFYRNISPNHYT